MKLEEIYSKFWKAGGFPFYRQDDNIFVALVIPTDPAYGGDRPQIAKGTPDAAELDDDPIHVAKREVSEETGIPESSFISTLPIRSETITGLDKTYTMHVYAFEVDGPITLKPDYEVTAAWYILEDALKNFRPSQRVFIEEFAKKVN